MKIGIFDHLDNRGIELSRFYEDRLKLVSAYDQHGFYAYHVAEHHFTPLGLSPSPSVYLSAIAQRTQKILFGPLVYTLPLYHPLRLADEICMLDHMSNGRLQLGIGRGVSPFELGYYGVNHQASPSIYLECFDVLMQSLTQTVVDHHGEHFQYENVPIVLKPFQKPHPPLWYGIGHPTGVDWCVENGVNAVVNGPLERVKLITDLFRSRWEETQQDIHLMPLIGTSRHVIVALSHQEAQESGQEAYEQWHGSFMHLFNHHNSQPQFNAFPQSFKEASDAGLIIAGRPQEVLERLMHEVTSSGVNYLLARFAFGNLSLKQSLQSTELFAQNVMPALQRLHNSPINKGIPQSA
jgi:alkanesulfonate monooxygenase SsuD/methylene tetrahydromethanopterin reductase-like flavin-dependent oxidoreductase (luciferase family)